MLIERLIVLVLIIFLSPILLCLAVLVRLNMGSPVLFKQKRPGKGGDIFIMIKYRTMLEITNLDVNTHKDKDRITNLGKFLRSTSLDELPTLWNVLKGDMSLVGPRPLLVEYLPLYNDRQSRRHDVKPGMTGWAQINGRNSISWENKFEMDIWYVENRSLWLNIKILWKTVFKVFKRDGISQDGHATMPLFIGNQKKINKNEYL